MNHFLDQTHAPEAASVSRKSRSSSSPNYSPSPSTPSDSEEEKEEEREKEEEGEEQQQEEEESMEETHVYQATNLLPGRACVKEEDSAEVNTCEKDFLAAWCAGTNLEHCRLLKECGGGEVVTGPRDSRRIILRARLKPKPIALTLTLTLTRTGEVGPN